MSDALVYTPKEARVVAVIPYRTQTGRAQW